MKTKILLLSLLFALSSTVRGQIQLEVGQTYQCFIEDYANRTYDWINISWEVSSGLTTNYYGDYVRTVSFSEYKSGTYSVTAKWTETDMGDPYDPFRHKSHTWTFTCKKPSDIKVTSISLSPTTMNLEVGKSQYISETVYPSNATNKSVSWSSSPTGIVTVSSTGEVKAVKEGTTTVTCKANDGSGKSATCTVTVSKPDVVAAEINATNFPDASFRSWLLSQSYGADGKLTESEINSITSISVSGSYSSPGTIKSLKGIEYFTALKYLYCSYNQLTSLDVSRLTALEFLNCSYNQLTSLDVSRLKALTRLISHNNQLTALDVLRLTALMDLYCDNNQLTTLDVSNNTALTSLWCDNNLLTALDVSKNTALTDLRCSYNQQTSLDVSNLTALKNLLCYNNQLTSLDVSNLTALTDLRCQNNQLTALDVSGLTALTFLTCSDNQLTTLDVSHLTSLTYLSCYNNQLTTLNVSNLTALKTLSCYNNQLTALEVSRLTALETLQCSGNKLFSLDVTKNKALADLLLQPTDIIGRV